jgi:uncharacterized protein
LKLRVLDSAQGVMTIPDFVDVDTASEHVVKVFGPNRKNISSGHCDLPTDRGSVLLIDDPMAIPLEPAPVKRDWVLGGTPEATAKTLYRSRDWLQTIVVWECTPGRFKWHYSKEEVLFIIAGHAVLTNERGEEREFGPGDTVSFPAGVSCTWLVKDRVRKVAVVREPLIWPLGIFVKACVTLFRKAGLARKSSL